MKLMYITYLLDSIELHSTGAYFALLVKSGLTEISEDQPHGKDFSDRPDSSGSSKRDQTILNPERGCHEVNALSPHGKDTNDTLPSRGRTVSELILWN